MRPCQNGHNSPICLTSLGEECPYLWTVEACIQSAYRIHFRSLLRAGRKLTLRSTWLRVWVVSLQPRPFPQGRARQKLDLHLSSGFPCFSRPVLLYCDHPSATNLWFNHSAIKIINMFWCWGTNMCIITSFNSNDESIIVCNAGSISITRLWQMNFWSELGS